MGNPCIILFNSKPMQMRQTNREKARVRKPGQFESFVGDSFRFLEQLTKRGDFSLVLINCTQLKLTGTK